MAQKKAPAKSPMASKRPHPPEAEDDNPQQSTSGLAIDPVTVEDESDQEEEITLWSFYDKDPKFVKDPKNPQSQYPHAICRRCKTRVPRTLAGTKGMNQHLENHHPNRYKQLMEAKLKASKAKVCSCSMLNFLTAHFLRLFHHAHISIFPDIP